MDRAELIVRLALMDGFVNQAQAAGILADYRQAAASGVPMPPTEEWAAVSGWLDPTMAGVVAGQLLRSRFKCVCGWEGPGQSALPGTNGNAVICPGCKQRPLTLVQPAPPHTQRYVAPPTGSVLTRSQAGGPLPGTQTRASASDDEVRLNAPRLSDDEVTLNVNVRRESSTDMRASRSGTGIGGIGSGSSQTGGPLGQRPAPNVPAPLGRSSFPGARGNTGGVNVDTLAPGTMVDDWRIERRVGEGAVGVVYQARDVQLERLVAIKVLNTDLLTNANQIERFRQEARVLAQLEHANILTIYRLGAIGVRPYIVMQWVDGESMAARIKRGMRSQGLAVEVELLIQAAKGLHAAHGKRITHRDVKSDNLMITREGVVKVADFGLAQHADSQMHLSRAGGFIGTPAYAAPEQMDGAPADQRVDVFALGITAFELVCGRLPFLVNSIVDLAYHQKNTPLPSAREFNKDVSPEFDRLLQDMCAKRADDRPQSMAEVMERLEFISEFSRSSGTRRAGANTRLLLAEESGDDVVYVAKEGDTGRLEKMLPDYPAARSGFENELFQTPEAGPADAPDAVPENVATAPAADESDDHADLIPAADENHEAKSKLRAELTRILTAAPGQEIPDLDLATVEAATKPRTNTAGTAVRPRAATTGVGSETARESGRQKSVRLTTTTAYLNSRPGRAKGGNTGTLLWLLVACALVVAAALFKSGILK